MLGLPTETQDEVLETISMLKEIDPDYYSPAFYTPHPGSDLYDYCIENDLSLIVDHDSYRRNPDEAKIKGVDYEWLQLGAGGIAAAHLAQPRPAPGAAPVEALCASGKAVRKLWRMALGAASRARPARPLRDPRHKCSRYDCKGGLRRLKLRHS